MPVRIFLVEDNSVIRESLTETWADLFSVEIVGFAEGESEAIVKMQSLEWDVALVDLFLKQGSGLSVARAFKSRGPPRRLFVVTNYATADMRRRCAEVGVDALFDKSVELDALFEALGGLASPLP